MGTWPRYWGHLLLVALGFVASCSAYTVDYDSHAMIINGQRKIIMAGSIHYPRSTAEMWPDLIQKAKEGGIDTIETYIFWNLHEAKRREYDFTGNLDFVKFFQLIHQAGLYGILRIGPYVCAEWNYGGFPMWLHNTPGIQLRTDNDIYKQEMEIFTAKIVNMAKEAKLFAPQGGPIIIAQIENEYGNIMGPYGDAGKKYIKWCAQMAVAQNVGVPWIMCQQNDAPQPMINTCNGFYCDSFKPNNPKSPKMWTENWTGWFKAWGGKDPRRTAEDVAYAVAKFFQHGGVLNNYYMYHGGTNFGRNAGGPYITTSYDYDAPLDEYGNPSQPKYGHLKQLHAALKVGESCLTSGNVSWKNFGPGVDVAEFKNSSGARFCMVSNNDNSKDANVDLGQDGKFFVPAWSISILDGCKKEIHNTAKVNTQTNIIVKRVNNGQHQDVDGDGDTDEPLDQPIPHLNWEWAPEPMRDTLQGKGRFKASVLLDQKSTTFDISDYLWYMTSIDINETIWNSWNGKNATLRVGTNGHALYAYFNRKYLGHQFSKQAGTQQTVKGNDYSFMFEKPVALKLGTNVISLLSATVGLANYGARFDLVPVGLVGGTVQLVNSDQSILDITSSTWMYKVGMNGEVKRLFDPNTKHKWYAEKLPVGRQMTWYKTTFQTPAGTDPVVLDLLGMGKGFAWVNGNNIGRYWPSANAEATGCSDTCDYRGKYESNKCKYNCGNPSQRYYHVPRSFLSKNGVNTLILFEEYGGNTSAVSAQIVTIAKVCGNAYMGGTLELYCQGGLEITHVEFASFGDPQGTCGSFKVGSYQVTNALAAVEQACVGRPSCAIEVSDATFGLKTDVGIGSRLAVQAVCG